MSCPSDDTLIALLERALVGDALHALEAHVDRCATCRATVGHLAAVSLGVRRGRPRRRGL